MKKAVIYYSKTGNTEGIAKQLSETHGFDLLPIQAASDDPSQLTVELTQVPSIKDYQHIVFAGPVHAFSISKIMKSYLEQLDTFSDQIVDLYITHHFPFAWLGGNRTLKQMKRLVESKQGIVRKMTSVNWSSKKRQSVIDELINSYK